MVELHIGNYRVTIQKTTDHNLYRVQLFDKGGKLLADSNIERSTITNAAWQLM